MRRLESLTAQLERAVTMPEGFVLPGATPASGALDLARTIVRRAERLNRYSSAPAFNAMRRRRTPSGSGVAGAGVTYGNSDRSRTVDDLYFIIQSTMPKNDPGSLADEDYGVVLAYILQMNKLPPGKAYLSTDTLELRKIRFDTVRTVRKP